MDNINRYKVYSQYLRNRYGEKVYKIPINLPVTCPNRDGTAGCGGCIFCGEEGAGFETLSQFMPVSEQLETNITYIREKYKAQKFIAYFQNYTNTYLSLEAFKKFMVQACREDVVEIAISTRPDCIHDDYLAYLQALKERYNLTITIELGLQTVNYHTLKKINRGHSLAEFLDAVLRIKKHRLETCVHLILNLPWDNEDDVIEDAKFLSALGIEQIKLHSLYIRNDTVMGRMYEGGEFEIITLEEYVRRVILFLEYLNPDVVIQRLIGRAPEENSLFCNWNTSWWKIKDRIDESMEALDTYQGKRFDYLHGSALKEKHQR